MAYLHKQNEIIPIQLIEEVKSADKKTPRPARLAVRLRHKDGSEVLIYNGINQYILQAVLKELNTDAS
nr:hypothetical protein [Vagococcus acidifermentans]